MRPAVLLHEIFERVSAGFHKNGQGAGTIFKSCKISGVCGRLMCCLKYEQDVYEELIGLTPKVGSVVRPLTEREL